MISVLWLIVNLYMKYATCPCSNLPTTLKVYKIYIWLHAYKSKIKYTHICTQHSPPHRLSMSNLNCNIVISSEDNTLISSMITSDDNQHFIVNLQFYNSGWIIVNCHWSWLQLHQQTLPGTLNLSAIRMTLSLQPINARMEYKAEYLEPAEDVIGNGGNTVEQTRTRLCHLSDTVEVNQTYLSITTWATLWINNRSCLLCARISICYVYIYAYIWAYIHLCSYICIYVYVVYVIIAQTYLWLEYFLSTFISNLISSSSSSVTVITLMAANWPVLVCRPWNTPNTSFKTITIVHALVLHMNYYCTYTTIVHALILHMH